MIPRNRTRMSDAITTPNPTGASRVLNSHQILNRSIDLSFGIIVVALNVAEIILLTRTKRKKKIYEILLLSLSAADLLFGLSNGIVCITFLSNNAAKDILEVTYTTYFYFVLTSILHLTWMTLDRVWAIYSPLKHRMGVTRKRTYILIVITWVTTTLIAISLYLSNEYTNTFRIRRVVNYNILVYDDTTTDNVIAYGNSSVYVTTTINTYSLDELLNNNMTKHVRTRYRAVTRVEVKKEYQRTMTLTLSIFILIADVVFISSHSFILYWLNKKKEFSGIQRSEQEEKFSLLCIFIAGAFILFTLPYAVERLKTGVIPLWANLILVSNSGMNCMVYFFRGKCDQYLKNLRKENAAGLHTPQANTPLSTPNGPRKELITNTDANGKLTTLF